VNRLQPTIVCVADIAAVPWRNGGGVTRELLAWPDPQDWSLRVSVADIHASGPFSAYLGVDRWFAVLDGGSVCLNTAGSEPRKLTPSQNVLHEFSGDAPTHCTALGPATRDFNIMARRSRIRVLQQPLPDCSQLETHAEGVGLFVVRAVELQQDSGPVWVLPDMALAWWPNPRRERLSLRLASAGTRGWWFQVDGEPAAHA
jgi:uncharacterized protein